MVKLKKLCDLIKFKVSTSLFTFKGENWESRSLGNFRKVTDLVSTRSRKKWLRFEQSSDQCGVREK